MRPSSSRRTHRSNLRPLGRRVKVSDHPDLKSACDTLPIVPALQHSPRTWRLVVLPGLSGATNDAWTTNRRTKAGVFHKTAGRPCLLRCLDGTYVCNTADCAAIMTDTEMGCNLTTHHVPCAALASSGAHSRIGPAKSHPETIADRAPTSRFAITLQNTARLKAEGLA
ncbi:hypothetical protein BD413DRAFT_545614 [Trametes elegans]|nr:hypothetical protein BD413DRAFT_545614 [Trametes elegans]